MRLGANHPMGPLELADFIGLDTCLSIMSVLYDGLADSKYRPCPLLVKYVEAGWIGKKVGRGFYDRSEEHTSELQSLMRNSYAVFCLKKKINQNLTNQQKHVKSIE